MPIWKERKLPRPSAMPINGAAHSLIIIARCRRNCWSIWKRRLRCGPVMLCWMHSVSIINILVVGTFRGHQRIIISIPRHKPLYLPIIPIIIMAMTLNCRSVASIQVMKLMRSTYYQQLQKFRIAVWMVGCGKIAIVSMLRGMGWVKCPLVNSGKADSGHRFTRRCTIIHT